MVIFVLFFVLNGCAKSQRTHFLSVLTVHWPSAMVRVTPLYWMCGRVVYLGVAFLHHIHAANVCEKFVNCESFFCMNPVKDGQMRLQTVYFPVL